MKIVSDLYQRLKDVEFYRGQFDLEEGKGNILFIDPEMSSFDFYTMIVPYLALPETAKYNTAMTGLYRFSEVDQKPPTKLSSMELRWANIVVLPMSLELFGGSDGLYADIRSVNPEIKIIQTCEFDFYELTNDHYLLDEKEIEQIIKRLGKKKNAKTVREVRKELKQRIIDQLEQNYRSADRIVTLNHQLAKKLKEKGFSDVKYAPILIEENEFKSNIDYMDTLGLKGTSGMFFLSVDLNENTKNAFKEFIPQFTELREKHENNFRLVVIGDHPTKYFSNFEMEVDHLSRGSIVHQFKNINKSSADLHLILNKKSEFSANSDSLIDFVEHGMFGIPCVTLENPYWKDFVKDKQNGFLLKNRSKLVELVDQSIEDKSAIMDLSKQLKASVIQNSQISEENLNQLGYTFFGGYNEDE
jgi:glycosyltransferase involved in cell wall biosynthesis